MSDSNEDFFLPDLCNPQSILLSVLVAELLVFVLVLANSNLLSFSWSYLALTSLLVQWVVLVSIAILCNVRPWLAGFSIPVATAMAYGVILLVTAVFSVGAEVYLMDEGWTLSETGNVARNLLVAAVMGGIAFRYFFLQHQLRAREQAELSSRVQALQSRIRPHFLFNSMNIIASLIAIDPDVAEEVVEDLSVLFRASLSDSTGKPVRLSEELDLCRKYVHIESLRLDDRLTVDWRIELDPDNVRIPMLTLQPLLENAIYHGIQPRPDGGKVTVRAFRKGDQIELEVTNPVAEAEHLDQSSHEKGNKMALQNIRWRLDAVYGGKSSVTTQEVAGNYVARISYTEDGASVT